MKKIERTPEEIKIIDKTDDLEVIITMKSTHIYFDVCASMTDEEIINKMQEL